jgi:plasmid stabilization system protein ParE
MECYVVAPAAERDIEAILAWSEEQFGEQARQHGASTSSPR